MRRSAATSGGAAPSCGGVVVVVNSPGNGIADDKAMYRHIPDLIAYYLGERPKVANVPATGAPTPRIACPCSIVSASW
jgi:uncharacterized circularly permuted ATP-grasp superfamily protein